MSDVVILGAGPIGGAIAHRLACRSRIGSIRLVDESAAVAQGKALDIRQAGPVERTDTVLDSAADPLAAAGADIIVVADGATSGPWDGDRGLALLAGLVRAGSQATFVFACPSQTTLLELAHRELGLDPSRLIGTAAAAVVGSARALTALDVGWSPVQLSVVGRPPTLTIGWSTAVAGGTLVADRVPAHRLRAMSAALGRLWPPGPFAIASATAPVVEGLRHGSRQAVPGLVVAPADLGVRGRAALLTARLDKGRVLDRIVPTLSPQERTELANSLR